MNLIYFDTEKHGPEELQETVEIIKEKLNDDVLALSKDFSVILDCSKDQLIQCRDYINKAILSMDNKTK